MTQQRLLSNFDRLGNIGNCSNKFTPKDLRDDVKILDQFDPWLYLALASSSTGSAIYPDEWIKNAANQICIVDRFEDCAMICFNTVANTETDLEKEGVTKLSTEEVINAVYNIRIADQLENGCGELTAGACYF